jgi:hypothetical protein
MYYEFIPILFIAAGVLYLMYIAKRRK